MWDITFEKVAKMFKKMKEEHHIELDLINTGGGLPANYIKDHKTMKEYSANIIGYLNKHFPEGISKTFIMEPGISLFGNAGVTAITVVLVSQKEKKI